MTTPPPPPPRVRGPLVDHHSQFVADLAALLVSAAEELYDAATLDDAGQMYEDARRAASRVLAACPI